MCVIVSTIGCLDRTARPDPNAPLREPCDVRQEKGAVCIVARTDFAHVPPVFGLDPDLLQSNHVILRFCQALCQRF